jgi:hypothetical protein
MSAALDALGATGPCFLLHIISCRNLRDGMVNAHLVPTKVNARVEDVPLADIFRVVCLFFVLAYFHYFRFSCWRVEHSQ